MTNLTKLNIADSIELVGETNDSIVADVKEGSESVLFAYGFEAGVKAFRITKRGNYSVLDAEGNSYHTHKYHQVKALNVAFNSLAEDSEVLKAANEILAEKEKRYDTAKAVEEAEKALENAKQALYELENE